MLRFFAALTAAILCAVIAVATSSPTGHSYRFALDYSCEDFQDEAKADAYVREVVRWERRFASAGVGFDAATGYSYDGHPLDYATGEHYGDPHLFSAPSKESIHVSLLALAVSGNKHAEQFAGGSLEAAVQLLDRKMRGYEQFNATYPAYGCFTPWVGFGGGNSSHPQRFLYPIAGWDDPYRVPGLDNGEWFWALFAATEALEALGPEYAWLADRYRAFVDCQRRNAKMIFHRGDGLVSAVVEIEDPFDAAKLTDPDNYRHSGSDGGGYLDDPYEGETMTLLLYLLDTGLSAEERDQLWEVKRPKLQPAFYATDEGAVTVQRGFWFSTHEQWKTLLLPYLAPEMSMVRRLFANAEKVRVLDAAAKGQAGLLASVNDVTDGSQEIPDYISAAGVDCREAPLGSITFQDISRTDVYTPYAAFGLMLHDRVAGLCWYNNMLRAPRMQSCVGSTEAVNANGTEISPLTTWDGKATTVLAMLGGIGDVVGRGLRRQLSVAGEEGTAYDSFVAIISQEYELAFAAAMQTDSGDALSFSLPRSEVSRDGLNDWDMRCEV